LNQNDKFGLNGNGKTSFINFLKTIIPKEFELYPLVEKLSSHIIKVYTDDRFVFITDKKITYTYNGLNDKWVVRDINIEKYTEKMMEKYGDNIKMYILKPPRSFYLIKIDDDFTVEEFKKIYNFVSKKIIGQDIKEHQDSKKFKGVSNFSWYDIFGVELEKTFNKFEGNIYISDKIKLHITEELFENWRRHLHN
jgi:hypothetical protein